VSDVNESAKGLECGCAPWRQRCGADIGGRVA
jgi:hypothetical protein